MFRNLYFIMRNKQNRTMYGLSLAAAALGILFLCWVEYSLGMQYFNFNGLYAQEVMLVQSSPILMAINVGSIIIGILLFAHVIYDKCWLSSK